MFANITWILSNISNDIWIFHKYWRCGWMWQIWGVTSRCLAWDNYFHIRESHRGPTNITCQPSMISYLNVFLFVFVSVFVFVFAFDFVFLFVFVFGIRESCTASQASHASLQLFCIFIFICVFCLFFCILIGILICFQLSRTAQ